MKLFFMILAFTFLLICSLALAADKKSEVLIDAGALIGSEANSPSALTDLKISKNLKIEKLIEKKYNISTNNLSKLRNEKLRYSAIIIVLEMSKISEKSWEEVLELLKEKRSFLQVQTELKLTENDMATIRKNINLLLAEE